jgi:hypothetical protein
VKRRVVVHHGWVTSFREPWVPGSGEPIEWHETAWPSVRNEASLTAWVKHELAQVVGDFGRSEVARVLIASEDLWTDVHRTEDPEENAFASAKRFLGRRLPYPPDRIDLRACELGSIAGKSVVFVAACRSGMLAAYAKAFAAWGVTVGSLEPADLHALNHQRTVLEAQGARNARYVTEAGHNHAFACDWKHGLPCHIERDGLSSTLQQRASGAADLEPDDPVIIDGPAGWWSEHAGVSSGEPTAPVSVRRPWAAAAQTYPAPPRLAWQAAAGGHAG